MELELVPEDENEKPEEPAGAEAGDAPAYTGPERRKGHRRQEVDRREMVRFETREDRRSGKDRRRSIGLWKNRDF